MYQEIPCLHLTPFSLVPRGWGELRMETGDQESLVACPMVEGRVGHAMEVLVKVLERTTVVHVSSFGPSSAFWCARALGQPWHNLDPWPLVSPLCFSA